MHRKCSSLPLAFAIAFTAVVTALPASAGDKAEAILGKLGAACKSRVVEQFEASSADVGVRLGSTMQESLDSGEMTTDDLERDGASFDWEIRGRDMSGYCNVEGNGEVSDFEQW